MKRRLRVRMNQLPGVFDYAEEACHDLSTIKALLYEAALHRNRRGLHGNYSARVDSNLERSSRHATSDEPPPYEAAVGGFTAAPPAYYEAPSQAELYGWAPPYQTFPERPEANAVYTSSAPPPHPGIGGYAVSGGASAPPAEPGFIDPETNIAFVPLAPNSLSQPIYTPDDKKTP